jgi:SAM-dependent methyltransferase
MEASRLRFGALLAPGMTLLDLGCGPGRDSAYWTAQGLKTVGVDLSPRMIELARAAYPALDFRVHDALELPSLELTFDAAWMAYMLLHLPAAAAPRALEGLAGRLKEGAPLFIETAVGEASSESLRPVAGLADAAGRAIEVPYTIWAEPELRALLARFFTLEWSALSDPLPGRPRIFGAILRRR